MANLKINVISCLRKNQKQIIFYVFLNLAFLLCITLSSYIHIPLSGFKDRLFFVLHLLLLQFSLVGYIYIATLNKWVFKFFFIPVFFILSMFSYWVYTQDISVTKSLIKTIIESKASIIVDLITVQYAAFTVIIIIIIFYIYKAYSRLKPNKINWIFVLVTFISIISFSITENYRRNTFKSRMPYNVYFGFKAYYEESDHKLNTVSNELFSQINSLRIVLVLGETVRADHLGLNGYNRNTTPLLSQQKNLVSYKNVYTPHTYTATSLPRIITDASINDDNLMESTSLFDVFNACNYSTFWLGNQELERSYESIVRTNEKVILIDSLRTVMSFKKEKDKKLLSPLKKIASNGDNKSLVSIHMIGSHWWYEKRYSENYRKYQPVIDSKHVPSQSQEQMVNSYDNTILYLDSFLNEIIKIQEGLKKPTIMIYISDHGEALGEKDLWFHGHDELSCMNPAMIVWFSDEFKNKFPNKANALLYNKDKYLSTDILYHSMLDLIEVENFDYESSRSVFSSLLNEERLSFIKP